MDRDHPLKLWREKRGLTLDELAERVGSSKATLSRIESGKQTPSLGLIGRLKEATNGEVTADDFLAGVAS
jgi:transcriptional regulator with XRE-family HTH domain